MINQISWLLWIGGTVMVALSWTGSVSGRTGWIGFGIALAGTILSLFRGRSRRCCAPQRAPAGAATAALDDLAKLADLRERGAITEQEYFEKKKALLGHIDGHGPSQR